MIPVKRMIMRIRFLLHDEQKTGYDDIDVLDAINDAVTFVGRMIKDIRPNLLSEMEQGTIEEGTLSIKTSKPITSLIDVRIDDKRLKPTEKFCIERTEEQNDVPTKFFLQGFDTLVLHPIPRKKGTYTIIYVPEQKLLQPCDETPYPNDFDNVIIEYALTRLSISNEFDMSQEMSIIQTIVSQIENILYNYPTSTHRVLGYYDDDESADCVRGYN